jgi:hypothetical protein
VIYTVYKYSIQCCIWFLKPTPRIGKNLTLNETIQGLNPVIKP